jgi:hypothetical protein
MFMVAWEGKAPGDKAEWIEALKGVFAGAVGTYRVTFRPGANGWRLDLECRDDALGDDAAVIANSPDTIRFNLVQALVEQGKPVDPEWRDPGPVQRTAR